MVYYFIFGFLAAFAVFEVITYKEKNIGHKVFYILACCFIFLFCVTRIETGYDYSSYEDLFNLVKGKSLELFDLLKQVEYEIGFLFLCNICTSYRMLIVVMGAISVIPMCIIIYRKSDYPFLVLAMYFASLFLTYHMGVIRQGVSMTLFFLAFLSLEQGKNRNFWVYAILSLMFHRSGFVLIVILLFKDRRLSRKFAYTLLVVSVVISFVMTSDAVASLVKQLPINSFSDRIRYYQTTSLRNRENLCFSIIKRALIYVFFYECYKMNKIEDKFSHICLNSYLISIVIMAFLSSIPVLGGRGTAGLYMAQIFIFPRIIKSFNSLIDKMLILTIVIMLYYRTLQGPIEDAFSYYLPYRSIWIH